ncbi:MAG: hypothetical protein EBR42_12765, partial [Betaproteobacteria bacterium]|nr:hypothetical protein [Betaproteobacteria bacterium]
MFKAVLALATVMVATGGFAIFNGMGMILNERGWTQVIGGSVVLSTGLLILSLAALLAHALGKAGFESISVGQDANGPIVQLENYSYNWNQLDALGVAMGVLTQKAFDWPRTRLQILRHGLPIYLAVGKPSCMFSWLEQTGFDCGTTEGVQLWAGQHAKLDIENNATWWVLNERSSTGRTKMFITPAMDSRVGTEYGTFDSTWGLNLTWQTPLWKGATADVAYVKAAGHSSDYAPGG